MTLSRVAIPKAENLFKFSEQFDNAYWDKQGLGTTVADSVTSPLSTAVTGDTVVENGSAGTHFIRDTLVPTIGRTYSVAYYVQAAGRNKVSIYTDNITKSVTFTLSGAGTKSSFGTITTAITAIAGGSWYLIEALWVQSQSAAETARLYCTNASDAISYTGSSAASFYVFGGMCNTWRRGPYTLTTSAAVSTGALRPAVSGRVAVSTLSRVAVTGRVAV